MECIFLNAAGTTLFVRDDMESGHWVQEQMNVTAEFPFDAGKVIQIGQRIAFRDPATDTLEVFEIVNVVNQEPDHYQQITAEHICIAELSDEHINNTEITDKTAVQALTTALTGTLWIVGNNSASGTQSADLSRGSVWDAVNAIQQNWNVYITPRVTISSAGAITGRYLDIAPAQGTWRGLRLSVRKNLIDPAVTYDDSEVYTALYGYGGSVDVAQTGQDDKTEELTFKDVVWTATSEHPAKPSGQTYLEWPEKTAIYGRNGRPRYGYYQNANIKDAAVLLQKTWESLHKSSEPKISISGTCVDLYRLGYKDQPIRLHDMAIVEIEETGELLYRQVICNDVDLVDPTGTRPEIGDYIPNIVYINRDTNESATTGGKGGGGGGGRGSMTNLEDEDVKTWTEFVKTNNQIGMVVGYRDGTNYIKAGQIILAINESGEPGQYESAAYINANHVNISATDTAHLLAGSIVYDENGNLVLKESTGGGVLVEHNNQGTTSTFGVWDKGNLTGGVMVQTINGTTETTIRADKINIQGIVNALVSYDVSAESLFAHQVSSDGECTFDTIVVDSLQVNGNTNVLVDATVSGNTLTLEYDDGSTVSFSKAASLSGAWASGVFTVTAGVDGSTCRTSLTQGAASWSGETVTIPLYATINNGATVYNTGKTVTATYPGGGSYEQGWNDCIDAATGAYYLSGYNNYNSGNATQLYTSPSSAASIATGAARVWRYGGSSVYRYTLPAKK